MNERSRALGATTHPLVLGAAALIVVNDLVFRGRAPVWLTGKLSDVGWLIVAPVFVAAVLALVRVPRARLVGFVVSGSVYVALQVWPPLGAFVSAGHVADVGDLWVLPAMFGAVVVWRTTTRGAAFVGVPLLAGVLAADIWDGGADVSWPCGEGTEWDAVEPLRLKLAAWGGVPADSDAFVRGLRLTDADGAEVPLVVADGEVLVICARDGLRADADYTWEIGPWEERSSNEVGFEHPALPTVRFRTGAGGGVPVSDAVACAQLATDLDTAVEARCERLADTGADDTGDW